MRTRYRWWKLVLLAAVLLGTFALMVWFVITHAADARRQGPPEGAGQTAPQEPPTSDPR